MWAVELGCYSDREDALLLEALARQAVPYRTFRGHELRDETEFFRGVKVPYGSCWFVSCASESPQWRGDWWGHPADFDCTAYYGRYPDCLLNADHKLTTLGEFCWNAESFFTQFANDQGQLFIRPNSGFKPFTGAVLSRESLSEWWQARTAFYTPMSSKVVVAPTRRIEREWRCLIVDNDVRTASSYGSRFERGAPQQAIDLVHEAITATHNPFRACVVDVAATDVGLRIIEIGCILCCSWYECDYDAIVRAIEEMTA